MRRAYFPVPRGVEQCRPSGARSVDLKDRRGSTVLLQAAGDFTGRCRKHDRQRLLQAGVSRVADGVRGGGAETRGGESGGKCRLGGREKRWNGFMGSGVYIGKNETRK